MACVQETVRWQEKGLPDRASVERSLGDIAVQKL
jgi:hypothetical protein